jgi:hypothetical protein
MGNLSVLPRSVSLNVYIPNFHTFLPSLHFGFHYTSEPAVCHFNDLFYGIYFFYAQSETEHKGNLV